MVRQLFLYISTLIWQVYKVGLWFGWKDSLIRLFWETLPDDPRRAGAWHPGFRQKWEVTLEFKTKAK